MVGNLRGVKESGALFAGPTYAFIGLIVFMILFGLFVAITKGPAAIQVPSAKMRSSRFRRSRSSCCCERSPRAVRR